MLLMLVLVVFGSLLDVGAVGVFVEISLGLGRFFSVGGLKLYIVSLSSVQTGIRSCAVVALPNVFLPLGFAC